MSSNPYETPTSDQNDIDDLRTVNTELRAIIRSLALWQIYMAVLGMLGFGLTMLAIGAQLLFSWGISQGGVEYAVYTMVALFTIGVFVFPSVALYIASRDLLKWSNSQTSAKIALQSQRGFWRLVSIFMLVFIGVYTLALLSLFGVAIL